MTGLRVLVVEDEWMVADHIGMLLEDIGCDVVGPAATIEDALVLLQTEHIDGALLDANLNGISSAPVAAALCAAKMPFVIVTGYGNLELPTKEMNAAPRLTKPFNTANFEDMISRTFAAAAQN
jgi:DNA-binding LytR/AlgR family response regulator